MSSESTAFPALWLGLNAAMGICLQRHLTSVTANSKSPDYKLGLEHIYTPIFTYLYICTDVFKLKYFSMFS